MPVNVDVEKVLHAARNAVPFTVKTYTLPHDMEVYLEEVLGIFLRELGRENLKEPLAYCLRELAVNAKKANTKRVYFKLKNLNIHNDEDYAKGMAQFKTETLENIDFWLQQQKDAGLYIKVVFHKNGTTLNIQVRNNAEITKKEQIRVYDRIARSRAFSSLEEALSTVLDDSEGAGLGIVILVLMLKKLNLDEDAFDIDVEDGETVARLTIPMDQVKLESLELLSRQIVAEIDQLPKFPENIVQLQRMLSDPDSEITDIARQISTDPALTADLLRLVNSAQFMLPKKVDNIVEAVKMVGLRGLRNLLYSYGTQKLLGGVDSEKGKALWQHSYRTGFYAYSLAKNFIRKKDILDDVYVGGILHDMGKIVFSNVHPELLEKINRLCREKGIPKELFEAMTGGLNHAEIGGLIAEKWNFPEALISAIRFHHEPQRAPKEHREVVDTVYIANSFCTYADGLVTFEQLDSGILSAYRITTLDQFQKILERLSQAFDREAKV